MSRNLSAQRGPRTNIHDGCRQTRKVAHFRYGTSFPDVESCVNLGAAVNGSAKDNLGPVRRILRSLATLDAEPQAGRRDCAYCCGKDRDKIAQLAQYRQARQRGLDRRKVFFGRGANVEWNELDLGGELAAECSRGQRLRSHRDRRRRRRRGPPRTDSDGGDATVEAIQPIA